MSDHHGDRLDGWKVIADYLARDERTVQRWAKERGLPVHRLPGAKGASVFALRGELDRWVAGAPQVAPVATVVPLSDPIDAPPPEVVPTVRRPRRRWLILAFATTSMLVVIGVLSMALRGTPAMFPESIDVVGNAILAEGQGRILWRTPLDTPVGAPSDATWHESGPFPIQLGDLDGDQEPEVLALLTLIRADMRHVRQEFFCLSIAGKPRWSYTPEVSLTFGNRTYDGPWRMENWTLANGPRGSHVWLSAFHDPWWPSYIVAIDATGQRVVRFVHPGHIYALAQVSTDTDSYVVATGISNEYASAMLAVLDQYGAPATPPSTNPRFMCQGCPQGRPARYILFPQSELSMLAGRPYNRGYEVDATKSGIQVSVQEGDAPPLRALYQFSRTLTPESVEFSDAYWEAHRRFERDRRLDHSAEACPTRHQGMTVRIWEPARGWRDEHVKMLER